MAGKTGKNGKTRAFTSVNYSAARLAREKQRREYEQQKKEKLIFALFVVIILVMILFAILIFKKVLGNDEPIDAESGTDTVETSADTENPPVVASAYRNEVLAKKEIYTGTLLLIDSSHSYRAAETVDIQNVYSSRTKFDKASAKNGYVYSYYTAGTEEELESQTLAALNAMADEFYKLKGNNDLYIHTNSAYVKNASDEHATGRAFDLSVYTIDYQHYELDDDAISSDFDWIKQNYYKYGFIRRYPENKASVTGVSDEPYHFLYVGIPHAYYMYKNDLCLEEYLELLRTEHSFADEGKNNLVFTTEDGSRYEVYYVAADGDMVNVPVLADSESYTVSGDNAGGFVVTVKLK